MTLVRRKTWDKINKIPEHKHQYILANITIKEYEKPKEEFEFDWNVCHICLKLKKEKVQ